MADGKSPAKPWELSRSQTTPIMRSPAVAGPVGPRVPPRTYAGVSDYASARAGYSPYGSYGGSYGAYGGGLAGGYGRSPAYGRTGYGRMYGRGGYGVGGYGAGGLYGGVGPDGPMAPPGVLGTVQQTLHGFGQFSQLLDGSFFSMNESFMSLMDFINMLGEVRSGVRVCVCDSDFCLQLRHHAMFVIKAVTAVMFVQVTGRSVRDFVLGRSPEDADLDSFRHFAGRGAVAPVATKSRVWPRLLLIAGLLVVFGPFVVRHIARFFGLKLGSKGAVFAYVACIADASCSAQDSGATSGGSV